MAPRVSRVETLSRAQAQARLRQYSAVYKSEHSTAARQVYHTATTNEWITVEAAGSYLRLGFWSACPCNR